MPTRQNQLVDQLFNHRDDPEALRLTAEAHPHHKYIQYICQQIIAGADKATIAIAVNSRNYPGAEADQKRRTAEDAARKERRRQGFGESL